MKWGGRRGQTKKPDREQEKIAFRFLPFSLSVFCLLASFAFFIFLPYQRDRGTLSSTWRGVGYLQKERRKKTQQKYHTTLSSESPTSGELHPFILGSCLLYLFFFFLLVPPSPWIGTPSNGSHLSSAFVWNLISHSSVSRHRWPLSPPSN